MSDKLQADGGETPTPQKSESDYSPCPNCGKPPDTILGSEGADVGECGNRNCSVLQFEAVRGRSVDTDSDRMGAGK